MSLIENIVIIGLLKRRVRNFRMLAGFISKNFSGLKNKSDTLIHGSTDHIKATLQSNATVIEAFFVLR